MRTLNVRFAAILVASLLVFGILVVVVHHLQVDSNAEMFLREAEKAGKEGDLELQIKNLALYSRLRPDDIDRIAERGLLRVEQWEKLREAGKNDLRILGIAVNILEKSVRLDPSQDEARLKLVDLTMLMGRHNDAIVDLRALLLDDPGNADYLMLLAECQMGAQEVDDAVNSLKELIQHHPDDIAAHEFLARVYLEQRDSPEMADDCMLSLVENNPNLPEAHVALADHYMNTATRSAGIREVTLEQQYEKLALGVKQVEKALALKADDRQALRLATRIDEAIVTRTIMYRARSEDARRMAAAEMASRAIESLWKSARLEKVLDGIEMQTHGKRAANRDAALDAMLKEKDKVAAELKAGGAPTQQQLDTLALAAVFLIDVDQGEDVGQEMGNGEVKTKSAPETEDAAESETERQREPIVVDPGTSQESALAQSRQLAEAVDIVDVLADADYDSALMDYLQARLALIRGEWLEAIAGFHKASASLPENWPALLGETYYQTALCCKHLSETVEDDSAKADALKEKLSKADLLSFITGIIKRSELRGLDIRKELLNPDGDVPMAPNAARDLDLQEELPKAELGAYRLATVSGMEYAYDNAREYISQAIELYPDSPELNAVLMSVEMRAGNRDAAMKAMREGRDKVITKLKSKGEGVTGLQLHLIWSSALLLIENNELDEAETVVEVLADSNCRRALVDYLLARIAYGREDWTKALEKFGDARPGLVVFTRELAQTEYHMGICHARLGDDDAAIKLFGSALDKSPFMQEARAEMAMALAREKRMTEAVTEARKVAGMGANKPTALLAAGNILLHHYRRSDATPEQWKLLDQTLERLTTLAPGTPRVIGARVNSLLAQKRGKEAAAIAAEACRVNPDSKELWFTRISIARLDKEWSQVRELLAAAERQLGDCSVLRIARAECLRDRYPEVPDKQSAIAAQMVALIDGIDKLPPNERESLAGRLLNILSQTGNDPAVEKLARIVAAKFRNDARVRFRLLELAFRPDSERNIDFAKVDAALKELERVDGESARVLYGRAKRISLMAKDGQEDQLDGAVTLAKKAEQLEPTWPRVKTLLAGIYDRKKDRKTALDYFVAAIRLGESDPIAIRRASHLLLAAGRYGDAHALIGRLSVVPPELLGAASAGAASKGDFERALKLARDGVAANPENYRNHLWLGQALQVVAGRSTDTASKAELTEMRDEAEKAFRKATTLAPETPGVWVVAIQSLASMDKSEAAYELLTQAKKSIPADQADGALGKCHEALEMLEEAETCYERVLEARPDDVRMVCYMAAFYDKNDNPAKAETQLTRITSGKLKAEKKDVLWARRTLAQILSKRPDREKMQRAIALVEKNLAEEPSPTDEALLARLQARMPAGSDRKQAIATLERLKKENVASLQDIHTLAMLYRQQRDWLKFSDNMRQLIVSSNNDPRFVAEFIKALLARGDAFEARDYLLGLEQRAPHSADTYDTKARVLVASDKYDEAIGTIGKYVADDKAKPANATQRLLRAAAMLERLGMQAATASRQEGLEPDVAAAKLTGARKLMQAAEAVWLRYVNARPEQRIVLANFHLRQGRIGNALAVIETEWKVAEPPMLAQVAKFLLESPRSTPDQVSRTERVVQAALAHHGRALPLLRVLAEVRTNHGQLDEAEAYYREILKKNPGNGIVLNNLALLLAMQDKDLDEALEHVNKSIELMGRLGPILDTRASVYLALGRPKDALKDLDEALKIQDDPMARFHQAQAYYALGKKKEAVNSMKIADKAGLTLEHVPNMERKSYEDLKKALR